MVIPKKWKLQHAENATVERLRTELKVHTALCRLLALRGITDYQSANLFFRPKLQDLHDPFLMKGMDRATARIMSAIDKKEKIRIYGDYDVDGTTAIAVVYSFLYKNFPGIDISYYVPHRYREGYGISNEGIEDAAAQGVSLLITLDCGIKSSPKIAYAATKGIDVIICDHHMPDDDDLPDAYAILNPKQKGCGYPFKELSGCGIGYKLISALAGLKALPQESTERYLDLVATSIAADIVPMDGENRILAFYGMVRAQKDPCLALRTIKEISGIERTFTISDLVFVVAPRINAAGRMDDARKAIELFICEDPSKSLQLAEVLHADNFDRKEVDKSMTEEALALLEANDARTQSTILYQPHWHKGVVGIVASRIIDHHYKPTIVLTQSQGKITGSARSVNGFNIYEAINRCSDLLDNYGGHFFAAGLTLPLENLEAFKLRFEQVVSSTIGPESLYPEIEIDAELDLHEITPGFYNIIRQFEPFGPSNLRPVFISRKVLDYKGYSRVVKNAHIRFVVSQDNHTAISGIGFGLAEKFGLLSQGEPFDIIYTVEENEWNGNKTIQIKVLDLRAHLP